MLGRQSAAEGQPRTVAKPDAGDEARLLELESIPEVERRAFVLLQARRQQALDLDAAIAYRKAAMPGSSSRW